MSGEQLQSPGTSGTVGIGFEGETASPTSRGLAGVVIPLPDPIPDITTSKDDWKLFIVDEVLSNIRARMESELNARHDRLDQLASAGSVAIEMPPMWRRDP